MDMVQRLSTYIDAGIPILYLNSFEGNKCEKFIREAIMDYRSIISWSPTSYLHVEKTGVRAKKDLPEVLSLVNYDEKLFDKKVLLIKDIHFFINDPNIICLLRDFAQKIAEGLDCTIIILSSVCTIPVELEKFIVVIEMDPLSTEDIIRIVKLFIWEHELPMPNDDIIDALVPILRGISEMEIRHILAMSIADDGDLFINDRVLMIEEKCQMIKKSGILEMVKVVEDERDIGGLEELKSWLNANKHILHNLPKAIAYGVDPPKGVLITGMPGCGKSLTAKVAAKIFGLPLIRLDMGRLMGKYVGESERNMRNAIKLTESIAPCVLWIDELEKGFAGAGGNSGGEVTNRLLGTFLTWLQEKQSMTFVVATANNISVLPPELLRKGRFDEIFYVDLPNEVERKEIFEIHIGKRRKKDLANIDVDALVLKTEDYSGSGIEGIVKEAIKYAYVNGEESLTTEHLLETIKHTYSLSQVMKDSIVKLRKDYERCKLKKASSS